MIGKLFFINLILFNGLVDFYFYRNAICKLTKNRAVRIAHWVIDALFVIATFVMFFLTHTDEGISHVIRQGFVFIYLLVYLSKAAYMLFSLPSLLSKNKTFKRVFYSLGAVAGSVLFVSMLYGNIWGINALRVSEVEMVSDKIPEAFDGYTIVQIADLHVGNMRDQKILEKTLEGALAINPDLLVFCGDLVHSRTREVYPFRDVLSRFRAKDGIYTIMGNHDYGDYANWPSDQAHADNITAIQDFYRDIDWTLLNNTSVTLRKGADSIALIGVENWGEPPFPQYGRLDLAMQGVENAGYKILLSHNPNHWLSEVQGKTDIDLTLAGHTHAMQLAVRIGHKRYSPSAWRYELWGGLYQEGDQYIYVNEGIGAVLIPFRLGATPELTVITLRRKR